MSSTRCCSSPPLQCNNELAVPPQLRAFVYRGSTTPQSSPPRAFPFPILQKSPLYFLPAWGGFCGWGISGEDWWTKYNLGPDADPRCWMITEDDVLRVFHRCDMRFMMCPPLVATLVENNSDCWLESLQRGLGLCVDHPIEFSRRSEPRSATLTTPEYLTTKPQRRNGFM